MRRQTAGYFGVVATTASPHLHMHPAGPPCAALPHCTVVPLSWVTLILAHAFEQDDFPLRLDALSPAASTSPLPMPARQSASRKLQSIRLVVLPGLGAFIVCLRVKVLINSF